MKKSQNWRAVALITICLLLILAFANSGSLAQSTSNANISSSGNVQYPSPTPTPPPSPTQYTYIMSVSGSNYQILDGVTRAVLQQSTSSSQAFNYLLGSSGVASDSETLYIEAGAYAVPSTAWQLYKNYITITCESGVVLTKAGSTTTPVIAVYGSHNVIDNIEIDGNWLNQSPAWNQYLAQDGSDSDKVGILYYSSASYNLVMNSIIHGCRAYGIKGQWQATGHDNGAVNCTIYDIGANGWSTAMPAVAQDVGDFCTHCEVYNCGDVGIDVYGYNSIITDNYVHDIGEDVAMWGFNNAGWGIAVESGGGTGSGTYILIAGNTVQDCDNGDGSGGAGIAVEGSSSFQYVLIIGNTVTNSEWVGMRLHMQNGIVSYNTVSGYSQYGINLISGSGNTVYGNTGSFHDGASGTITTPPSITAVTVTSSPTGTGFVTANGVAGYAGSYSIAPYTFYAAVGSSVTLVANTVSGYTFNNWSDGGAQSHTITVPSSYQTYTATYS